jgi:opacity protein-like surface antigen
MRKMLLCMFAVFVLAVLLIPEAFAQGPFELGVRGGYNSSNATFDPDPYTVPGTSKSAGSGFWVGGAAKLPLSDVLAIATEPRYIQYALKVQVVSAGEAATVNTKVAYLEIPLFLNAGVGTEHVRFFGFAGPQLGLRLSANEDVDYAGMTTRSADIKDQFKSTSIGLAAGAGIEYKVASDVAFVADARYSRDLSNVSNAPAGTTSNQSVKYYGIQIGGGFMFALR